MDQRIYLSPPGLTGNEMFYIEDAFKKNWIAPMGDNLDEFELGLCRTVGIHSAAALSSGTAAIFMALKALGVNAGDTVFCSDLTFAGSCFPILHLGAIPLFIDSEPISCNMSPIALENALQQANKQGVLPKAVIIVDLFGNPANFDELLPICKHYNIPVLEDAAESLGAAYHQQNCGTFGEAGIFSFNGNKIITTSGGGMVVSDHEDLIRKIKFWAAQSREPVLHYEHKEVGYNFRLSNICAGIGRGQLTGLKEKIAKRKSIKDYYISAFSGYPVRILTELPHSESNNWLSVMLVDAQYADATALIIQALASENIESRPIWKPMHEQPVFRDAQFVSQLGMNDSISSDLFKRGICLPSGEALTEEQLDRIAETIKTCL